MSVENNNEAVCPCCAACGISEIDDIKLEECGDCDLVRYCSDECMEDHKSEHEDACKKRAAELRDEILFKQPESNYLGDCPICSLPLSIDTDKSTLMPCCSKVICDGCDHANENREKEARLVPSCPFCREPTPESDEECDKQVMKRVEANDPAAMCQQGVKQHEKGDYRSAFDYWTKAAALGDTDAHSKLSYLYRKAEYVQKDEEKEVYHLEEAAIGGAPYARYFLGWHEYDNGNIERAVKHWIIAATQGEDGSIKALMGAFRGGLISKEELAATLRAHKAAVDATKSPQRAAAEICHQFISSSHETK